jgi:hypothetical protein
VGKATPAGRLPDGRFIGAGWFWKSSGVDDADGLDLDVGIGSGRERGRRPPDGSDDTLANEGLLQGGGLTMRWGWSPCAMMVWEAASNGGDTDESLIERGASFISSLGDDALEDTNVRSNRSSVKCWLPDEGMGMTPSRLSLLCDGGSRASSAPPSALFNNDIGFEVVAYLDEWALTECLDGIRCEFPCIRCWWWLISLFGPAPACGTRSNPIVEELVVIDAGAGGGSLDQYIWQS